MKIIQAHQASFKKSPRVVEGGVVQFLDDDPKNPGWFLGIDGDGTRGYFPKLWFKVDTAAATALRDYDASELSVAEGKECTLLEEYCAWARVTFEGKTGWVPLSCLKR
ncbi:hypothetical protein N9908_04415 [Akkermansiaceae bacterium]|nr:hypothetical protein [Akkermansiaceae bacterium]